MQQILSYISDTVQRLNIKHVVHSFDSGALMIDIWIKEKFYVIQIDDNAVGVSLVTKDTLLFDVIPDQIFENVDDFKQAFEKIIIS